ncbi:MAG: hypothetical protein AAF597_09220 [Bacteroidota bacterium]
MKRELTRLGVILGVALLGIWGLEMVDRPGPTVLIVKDADGVGGQLVAKLRKERDSLAVLLAEARGDGVPASVVATAPERVVSAPPVPTKKATDKPKPKALGEALAAELRRLSGQERLLGETIYERALREKLPTADFASALERAEIKARIEALLEANKARTICNGGDQEGCTMLNKLSRDNRLTLAQQQMVYRMTEKL